MPLRVFRVCRGIHARLDEFGAKVAGGRWNSPGLAVVYTAENVALAVLLNPAHPEFRRIVIERPEPFEFDPRLFSRMRP